MCIFVGGILRFLLTKCGIFRLKVPLCAPQSHIKIPLLKKGITYTYDKTHTKKRRYLSSKSPTTVKIGRNQEIQQLWDIAYNLWVGNLRLVNLKGHIECFGGSVWRTKFRFKNLLGLFSFQPIIRFVLVWLFLRLERFLSENAVAKIGLLRLVHF